MTRRASAFRQIEITRLIRGVEAAGQKVKRIGFDEAGKPVAILSGDEALPPDRSPPVPVAPEKGWRL